MTAREESVEPQTWGRSHEVAVLAALELIPGVGGTLATVVEEVFDRRRARVQDLATGVLAQVAPADLIDWLRADPRFGDLFVLALERVARADWEPKRAAMGRVVVEALSDDSRVALDESERLLLALHELEAGDFAVLAQLHAQTHSLPLGEGVGFSAVPGLEASVGALYRHCAVIQVADYSLFYRSTSTAERLLALVSMAP